MGRRLEFSACCKKTSSKKRLWQNLSGYKLQLNVPLTTNNPGLLVGDLLSFSAVSEPKPLGSGTLKDRAQRVASIPQSRPTTTLRPQTEFCHGGHSAAMLCCFLHYFSALQGEPGKRMRLREGTGSPERTQHIADSQSSDPSLGCHLHLKIEAGGAAGPEQAFL